MRRPFFYAFSVLATATTTMFTLAGCGGTATEGPASTADLKTQAARNAAAGKLVGDPCATNHWYGDGVCDTFCPDKQTEDTDCLAGGTPVVCAAISEISDGKCGRKDDDPCRAQDPDCAGQGTPGNPGTGAGGSAGNPGNPGNPGTDPGGPTFCAAISEVSDGKCGRKADDPCRFQDPDCSAGSGCTDVFYYADGVCSKAADDPCRGDDPDCTGTGAGAWNCDTSTITCNTFAPVTCPPGLVSTVVNGCYGKCIPKDECAPMACPAIALAPDGVCSPQPDGPCPLVDPDCVAGAGGSSGSGGSAGAGGSAGGGVACAQFIEQPNGVCSRPADDPCRFQDPDCSSR